MTDHDKDTTARHYEGQFDNGDIYGETPSALDLLVEHHPTMTIVIVALAVIVAVVVGVTAVDWFARLVVGL